MSPQLPTELLVQIAHSLPFEELWRVRNVNFLWNEIALHRAWSLLYVDSEISIAASIGTITFKSRPTSDKPGTDLLGWHCENPNQLISFHDALVNYWEDGEDTLFIGYGIVISLPQTSLREIYLDYHRTLRWLPRDASEESESASRLSCISVGPLIWPKKHRNSETLRIADWTLQSEVEHGKESTLCMKLKLWQLVELHLKRCPFEIFDDAGATG